VDIFRILIGILVLTLGRKLFWLFVAVVGFAFGASLGSQFFQGQPDWVILIIALGAGLLGALLALFLQKVAIALAGFIGGGYIALYLVNALGWGTPDSSAWLPFLIGGVIGLVLMIALFDWALIALSSLIGAGLIVQADRPGPIEDLEVFQGVLSHHHQVGFQTGPDDPEVDGLPLRFEELFGTVKGGSPEHFRGVEPGLPQQLQLTDVFEPEGAVDET